MRNMFWGICMARSHLLHWGLPSTKSWVTQRKANTPGVPEIVTTEQIQHGLVAIANREKRQSLKSLSNFFPTIPDGHPLSPCLTSEKRQILISRSVSLHFSPFPCFLLSPSLFFFSLPGHVSSSVSFFLSEPWASLVEQMEPYIPIALRRPEDLKCKRDECGKGSHQSIKGKGSRDFQLKACSLNTYCIPKTIERETKEMKPLN